MNSTSETPMTTRVAKAGVLPLLVGAAEGGGDGVVAAHGEERAGDLDERGLEGGDRREHDRDDEDVAADAGPDDLAERAQDVAAVLLDGLGRQHDQGGDGEDLEEQEDDDDADDPAEAGVLVAVLGLFVEVRRDVPAPVVEGGDERGGDEARRVR